MNDILLEWNYRRLSSFNNWKRFDRIQHEDPITDLEYYLIWFSTEMLSLHVNALKASISFKTCDAYEYIDMKPKSNQKDVAFLGQSGLN